jgi:hypothetical protein
MNPEIKQKWVDALRSGKYKQGIEELKDSEGRYCCLGVLCVVTKQKKWAGRSTLPEHIQANVGVTECGDLPKPIYVDGQLYSTLTGLNDFAEYDFNRIADIIEEQL